MFTLCSTADNLASMDSAEFSQHVEALAKIILEKPKRMSEINSKYWLEISSKQLNFDRDEIEV